MTVIKLSELVVSSNSLLVIDTNAHEDGLLWLYISLMKSYSITLYLDVSRSFTIFWANRTDKRTNKKQKKTNMTMNHW